MSGQGEGVFNDSLIQETTKATDARRVDAFRFDFSPSINRLVRLEPIQKFRLIRELSLIGHSLTDISALQSLPHLRRLNLSFNRLRDFSPLFALKYLEDVSLNHNRIGSIPSEIASLIQLRILRLAFNQIDDRRDFARLQKSVNLVNLDLEGTPVAREPAALYYCVFTLPQLEILNRNAISIEYRRQAAERFERFQVEQLTVENEQLSRQNEQIRQRLAAEDTLRKASDAIAQELRFAKITLDRLESERQKLVVLQEQRESELKALHSRIAKSEAEMRKYKELSEELARQKEKAVQALDSERAAARHQIEELNATHHSQAAEVGQFTRETQ
jgi:hypothetical protein